MKHWKIILAAVVIFAAGSVTGGVAAKRWAARRPASNLQQRFEMLRRAEARLELSAPQRERVRQILRETRAELRRIWEQAAPAAREELRRARQRVRQELTAEQQASFDALLENRTRRRAATSANRARNPGQPAAAADSTTPAPAPQP
jgi:uncharacterized membrane protein